MLITITFIGLLIVPAVIFKMFYWMWFFISVGIVLIIFEIVAVLKTGKTISQQYQNLYKDNKIKALILASCWAMFFIYLIIAHLILGY